MNEDHDRAAIPSTDLEQNLGYVSLGEKTTPRFTAPVTIRVISYRKSNHDPDGISVKAVLDGIVRAGILTDDSSKYVKQVTMESRKAKIEKTIIEIED